MSFKRHYNQKTNKHQLIIIVILSFSFFIPLLYRVTPCGKSVKHTYIEFFIFDYGSLPISFQSGITFFPLVALDKTYYNAAVEPVLR